MPTAKKLLEYCGPEEPWNNLPWDSLTPCSWDEYHAWRLVQINGEPDEDEQEDSDLEPEEPRGNRAVDLERNTLNNAFKYSIRKVLITDNPVKNFPRFHSQSAVHHCREFQPQNADELHSIASMLFSKRRSEALAWQLLIEANSGLRTSFFVGTLLVVVGVSSSIYGLTPFICKVVCGQFWNSVSPIC